METTMGQKKKPGARSTQGRTKIKSAGPNSRPSRPKSDNKGQGKRKAARNTPSM
jgi:hypothetical protein